MLFRRFAIVTTCIALAGIFVSNLIESSRTPHKGFAVEERLKEWQRYDLRMKCKDDPQLCAQLTLLSKTLA